MKPLSQKRFDEILDSFDQIDPILVIGDIGVDKYTLGDVSRISPEAPVPVLHVKKEWTKLALAANVSHNLATLQVPSALLGVMGDDENAKRLEDLMQELHLRNWCGVKIPGRMTTLKERVTTNVQQICRVDYEDTSDVSLEIQEVIKKRALEMAKGHKIVILQDYGKGLFCAQLTRDLIQDLQKQGKMVVVDPHRTRHASQYTGADLVKPNWQEAQVMAEQLGLEYHKWGAKEMAQKLGERLELKKLVITLGQEGMCLWEKEKAHEVVIVPTVNCQVFDVSGAGDTALSALIASLASGASLLESAQVANAASGVVIGKKGTATLTREELSQFYSHFLTQIDS